MKEASVFCRWFPNHKTLPSPRLSADTAYDQPDWTHRCIHAWTCTSVHSRVGMLKERTYRISTILPLKKEEKQNQMTFSANFLCTFVIRLVTSYKSRTPNFVTPATFILFWLGEGWSHLHGLFFFKNLSVRASVAFEIVGTDERESRGLKPTFIYLNFPRTSTNGSLISRAWFC